MEPFTITCTSCASRVRVRNPDLLGQLANCPKCNSMILIAAPNAAVSETGIGIDKAAGEGHHAQGEAKIEVERQHGPTVDSTALTQEGLPPDLVGAASDGEPSVVEPSAVEPSNDEDNEYRLAPEPLEADSAMRAPPVLPAAAHTLPHAGATWNADGPAHLPSADWTSDSTTKTRQMLLVGFLGFTGVILAALLFVGFLRWYAKDTSNTPPAFDANAEAQVAGNTDLDNTDVDKPVADKPPAVEPLDTAPPAADFDDTATGDNVVTDNAKANEPPDGQDSEMIAAVPNAAAGGASSTADSTDDSQQSQGGDATPAEATLDLPKRLQAFGPMLQYEIQPQFSDATEILTEAPVTAEDLGLTTTVDSVEMPAVDLAAQSEVIVPALVMGEMPLSQFVSLWSNLSGIPTAVNLDSLAAAGMDRNQTLSLAMVQSATLGRLIEQIGAPLGLQAIPRDNRFLELVAPDSEIEQKLPAAISLAGLVAPEAEAWLIESLPQLFPEHSLEWKIEEGKLLRPQTDSGEALEPLAWFATVRLLEGWRQAAGLPPTLPEYAPSLLSAGLVAPSDVAGLDFVLQQVQPEARPLAQVIPRICREAGLQAWVDWPAVASIGIGPQTTALILTSQRPLRRALADYASEFSLVVAVLDKQTLWLTSNQAYRRTPQLYVIPTGGESADQWKSRLRPLTPAATGELGVGAVVAIATPDGKFILTRCCPMQVDFH